MHSSVGHNLNRTGQLDFSSESQLITPKMMNYLDITEGTINRNY